MKILLLDDDPFALRLLERQLANIGIKVEHACEHAEQALELLCSESTDVDVVFCDLQMPHMDGVEFLRNLAIIAEPPALVLGYAAVAEAEIEAAAAALARALAP